MCLWRQLSAEILIHKVLFHRSIDIMAEEIVNPFPSPPSHYRHYTEHNLKLLDLLRARTSTNVHDAILPETQQQTLSDQNQVPPWDLAILEKPRADWIIEQGGYETFGDFWPVWATQSSICRQLDFRLLSFLDT